MRPLLERGRLAGLACAVVASAWAGDGVTVKSRARGLTPAATIQVETTVVLIPVTVTDRTNRAVSSLDRGNFRLFEDKVEQKIVHFSKGDVPLSVGVVFDLSGSMEKKLNLARRAMSQFLDSANPGDEFFLVQFADRPELAVDFTTDPGRLESHLAFLQAGGRTALVDAVALALDQIKKANNPRRALLILSDGEDNSSRFGERELRRRVRESDVQIYAIGLEEAYHGPWDPSVLSQIAEQSGGRHHPVHNWKSLPEIATAIGRELRDQYLLGYTPANRTRDGKYRRVEVKVTPPPGVGPLEASWRRGYYALP